MNRRDFVFENTKPVITDRDLLGSQGNEKRAETVRGARFMKKEYDFSKGERGKFYHPDAELSIPIYLDPDIAEFIQKLAEKKGSDVTTIVNDWLRRNIGLVQSAS